MSGAPSSQIYFINSHKRLSGTHSDFTYRIDLPPGNKFDSVCALQVACPKSFYSIAEGSNTFRVNETNSNLVTRTYVVTINPGNYTRRGFQTYMASALTANSAEDGYALEYTIAVPNIATGADNGKYTFEVADVSPLKAAGAAVNSEISFEFDDQTSPAQQLGFDPDSTISFDLDVDVTGFGSASLWSTNVCNLQAESTIMIRSNICANGLGAMDGHESVLQEIFSNSVDYSTMVFQVGMAGGIDACRRDLRDRNSNTFSFSVTDEDGQPLNLNGQNLCLSLLVWSRRQLSITV